MKSVIERLDDIENTARSIVAKAEEDKRRFRRREISLIKNWMRRRRQNLPESGKMESGRLMNF